MKDSELIRRYLEEDDQLAFTQLYEKYYEKLKFFLVKYVKDIQTAEDILQESFVKIIEKIEDHYEEQGYFKTWMYTVCRNTAIDYLRAQKKFIDAESIVEDRAESYFELLEDKDPDAPHQLHVKEELEKVLDAFDQLPVEQQEIVFMRVELDMSFREIAEELEIPTNTALGRMRYARINLNTIMDGEPYEAMSKRDEKIEWNPMGE